MRKEDRLEERKSERFDIIIARTCNKKLSIFTQRNEKRILYRQRDALAAKSDIRCYSSSSSIQDNDLDNVNMTKRCKGSNQNSLKSVQYARNKCD